MTTIKHILITRYGIGVKDPRWFKNRLPFFKFLTLPSIVGQLDESRRWVLRIEAETIPKEALNEIKEIISISRYILVADKSLSFESILPLNPDQSLITSRIDDDDALRRDYFDNIEAQINELGKNNDVPEFFTFWRGIRLDLNGRSAKGLQFPFFSCSVHCRSQLGSGIDCYSFPHSGIQKHCEDKGFDYHIIENEAPAWIYLRHELADSKNRLIVSADPEIELNEVNENFDVDLKSHFNQRDKSKLKTNLMETYSSQAFNEKQKIKKQIKHQTVGKMSELA